MKELFRLVLVAVVAGALGAAVPAQLRGASVALPYTFANGTVADAAQVNDNFAALAAATNAHDTALAGKVQAPGVNLSKTKITNVTINKSMAALESYPQVFNYAGGCHTTTAYPVLANTTGGGHAEHIVSVNAIDNCQFRVYVHRPGNSWPNLALTVSVLSFGD